LNDRKRFVIISQDVHQIYFGYVLRLYPTFALEFINRKMIIRRWACECKSVGKLRRYLIPILRHPPVEIITDDLLMFSYLGFRAVRYNQNCRED